jgi:hypothetical protein
MQPQPQQPQQPQYAPTTPYPQQGGMNNGNGMPPQAFGPQKDGPDSPRKDGEMPFLYGAGIGYGVGTGIWIDIVAKIDDPGLNLVMPLVLGGAGAVGTYLWDQNTTLHRGVPSTTALGTALGFGFGVGIGLTQLQVSKKGSEWGIGTISTLTFLTTTGGAVGGYFFGDWLRPDPRSASFIASGAAMGTLSFLQIGVGVGKTGRDYFDAGSVMATIGYAAGTVGTAALSAVWTPSLQTQKWMWIGYGTGTVAGALVFPFYLATSGDPDRASRGFVATGLAGLAGASVAAVLAADLKDAEDRAPIPGAPQARKDTSAPTFNIAPQTMPGNGYGLGAFGQW